ncbi:MAG: lysoplasmalogenase [Bacteroidota bacterium]|nr:lysoplasmalogenase [Bacteroidota bacterium]
MFNRYGWYLFAADLAAEILAIAFGLSQVQMLTKPLLMPLLLGCWSWSPVSNKGFWIPLALIFSWAGDILLMGNDQQPAWFMGGIAAFLLAHICYIVFFIRLLRKTENAFRLRMVPVLLTVLYVGFLLYLLLPHAGHLRMPVFVYACVIGTMLLTVLHAFNPADGDARFFCVAGALLFVLSDSLLAINKFYQPFSGAGIAVMLTYGLAQYGLVKGSLLYLAERNKQ